MAEGLTVRLYFASLGGEESNIWNNIREGRLIADGIHNRMKKNELRDVPSVQHELDLQLAGKNITVAFFADVYLLSHVEANYKLSENPFIMAYLHPFIKGLSQHLAGRLLANRSGPNYYKAGHGEIKPCLRAYFWSMFPKEESTFFALLRQDKRSGINLLHREMDAKGLYWMLHKAMACNIDIVQYLWHFDLRHQIPNDRLLSLLRTPSTNANHLLTNMNEETLRRLQELDEARNLRICKPEAWESFIKRAQTKDWSNVKTPAIVKFVNNDFKHDW